MDTAAAPPIVCVGGIFIDDIVFPDGRTSMAVLGGGGVHAAAGAHIWDERAGLVANMGRDIPAAVLARLRRDFDLHGVVEVEVPQVRAWQVFEWDGKRTEIFRVDDIEPFTIGPQPAAIDPIYRDARIVTVSLNAATLRWWRAYFPDAFVIWEPDQHFMKPENCAEFRAVLATVDVLSPNLLETQLIYESDESGAALTRRLLNDGARVVALRMGEQGSLLGVQGSDALIAIPAVPVEPIVDVTGAGNTYCGGFAVGYLRTGDLHHAAAFGAVSAAFALEVTGVADPQDDGWRLRREARLAWVQAQMTV